MGKEAENRIATEPAGRYHAVMRTAIRYTGYAIGIVVLLAMLYVGAYYAMVEHRLFGAPPPEWHDRIISDTWKYYHPSYRVGGEWSVWLFGPMHALDRELRPKWWEED